MRGILAFFAAVFAALAVAGCDGDEAMIALNSAPIKLHYEAKNARLAGQNEPFMLFFYSKDCGVCEKQIPILNELARESGFKIIGVLGGASSLAAAKKNSKGTEFATVFEAADVEYLSSVVGGVYGVPAMFFYDAEGKLRKKYISLVPKSELKKQINLLS